MHVLIFIFETEFVPFLHTVDKWNPWIRTLWQDYCTDVWTKYDSNFMFGFIHNLLVDFTLPSQEDDIFSVLGW